MIIKNKTYAEGMAVSDVASAAGGSIGEAGGSIGEAALAKGEAAVATAALVEAIVGREDMAIGEIKNRNSGVTSVRT